MTASHAKMMCLSPSVETDGLKLAVNHCTNTLTPNVSHAVIRVCGAPHYVCFSSKRDYILGLLAHMMKQVVHSNESEDKRSREEQKSCVQSPM